MTCCGTYSCGTLGRRAVTAIVLLPVLLLLLAGRSRADEHSEELLLSPMEDGATLVHFESGSAASLPSRHTDGFPAALLSLVQRHGVRQLEVALTQGRWSWEHERQAGGTASAAFNPKPPGLELRVELSRGSTVGDTQAAYAALTQTLGGLLCAGVATAPQLAVMAAPAVGWFSNRQPAVAWGTAAAAAAAAVGQQRRRGGQIYAWLPQEAVCSENLGAWRRLLPCRQHAGLAALLRPLKLAAAPYYSLGLQLWVAPDTNSSGSGGSSSGGGRQQQQEQQQQQQQRVELRQVLTAVLPSAEASTAAAAASAAVQEAAGEQGDLLVAVFGSSLPASCSAASSSTLYLTQHAAELEGRQADVSSSCGQQHTSGGTVLACDAHRQPLQLPSSLLGRGFGVGSTGGVAPPASAQQPPPLQVVQHLALRGSREATLMVGVRVAPAAGQEQQHKQGLAGGDSDGHGDTSRLLHVMQLLPWQLMAPASSLRVELNGRALQPGSAELLWQAVDSRPDRTMVVELLLRLPSSSSSTSGSSECSAGWQDVALSLPYRAAFVGVFDHAPDASRGVDIPPALATLLPPACNASSSSSDSPAAASRAPLLQRLRADCGLRHRYSGGGVVAPLPLPDFSMPFNVVCFTSTLLAILFGGVTNVVLRSPQELAGGSSAGGSGPPLWRRKLRRVIALLLLMGVLAVYLDRDLQRQMDALLHQLVRGRTQAPEQHGEL